ncbi:MAG: RagB/SusD family nutrient uptake outer membrane protein [Bacteroidetes bacterium]|nr:RagB/SusD family nutrient uptake outer membrane protein [Bacteroidota bacterium]
MKKQILKNILVVLGISLFLSCENFLDENNIADVSAGSYYTTSQGLEDAVKATYGIMKEFYGTELGFSMNVFGTDTYTNGADGSHKYLNWYNNQHNSSARYFRDTWRIMYRGINQANAVINRAESIEDMDAAVKNSRIAEVRFLRALYYFNLVRYYGDVHLSLEETQGVETEANRTSVQEVYGQAIIPDLEFAASTLPATQSEYGRVTKAAAEFLLAKVHLTAPQGSAAQAANLMTNVINNYNFSLLDEWSDLWDISNEENSEVVWTMINSKQQVDEGLDGYGHRGHLYFLFEYDKQPGMTRDTENGRPWKRFRPTNHLLSLWDRTKDARYDKGYKHVWYANKPIPGQKVGDSALYIPGPGVDRNGVDQDGKWTQAAKDGVLFQVHTTDIYNQIIFPSLNKWIDNTRPNRQHTQGQRDFILMRLADAYLIRAEANLKLGNAALAAEDLNVIRKRAAWEGQEAAMEITANDVTIDFILDERARELVGEGHRWFDLVRNNKLIERVKAHNIDAKDNIQAYHILRPIPLDQIDRTEGGYAQNPGYTQ